MWQFATRCIVNMAMDVNSSSWGRICKKADEETYVALAAKKLLRNFSDCGWKSPFRLAYWLQMLGAART